ncbi:proline racemase family protein [Prosthecomicrobium sp. N25]|uniref:proline racemase family protein n=1 Tax=Prosthecomicrobium sp. N25 TaxID=3129254 RepID=UPI0030771EF6
MDERAVAIETVEMHTGGEAVRIVTGGWPAIRGETILDKRRDARERLDRWRRLVMHEPRGHYDMYGVLPVEPDLPGADMAVLFIHNEGYSTMCGHAVIALGRFAVDTGIVPAVEPVTRVAIQCPCGLVEAEVAVRDGRAGAASFVSVPAFAAHLDRTVEVPGYGAVTLDVGYGGAFYAILPAARLGLSLTAPAARLVEAADAVSRAVRAALPIEHPVEADLGFLYGTILTDGGDGREAPTVNVCVFADREVDRSPTGSGVTARVALMRARGEIAPGETRRFRSIVGSEFTGAVEADTTLAGRPAVRVRVAGKAHYAGRATFTIEPDDPFPEGFLVR